jgi:hypothetical protein
MNQMGSNWFKRWNFFETALKRRFNPYALLGQVVAGAGIEPATQGFSVLCSTD